MPELPDLQVFSRNLNKLLAGKTLEKVTVHQLKKLNVGESTLKERLEGRKLESIYREGKELRFKFDNDHILGMHLMLNGKLFMFKGNNQEKNSILELLFKDGEGIVLTDFRGLATPTLDPQERDAPDALSDELNASYLKERLKGTKTTVKNLLLDQNVIRGIGNAYADEILWKARISPFSVCNKIPDEKIADLADAIKSELKDAEKQILKAHPDIIHGEVRDFLKIHNSHLKKSPDGEVIQVKELNSRKTYFTEEQELY
ncbi:Fpg/Nei family DNA glycosylase [Pedobacter sp. HMF7647]|uniref:Fpg/Nei family DNA glycosylase n=1 Tax=Hufsiella arboris TaxID=2695275 RepID=A0A7K1Y8G1_9SPHI|nr:DNA-formamidopyrimidine glycosylase family protein [Hufsiella arboris]MXV50710.1 Fpg/Nei family DNA glycosylase [Hufsiella arboris]